MSDEKKSGEKKKMISREEALDLLTLWAESMELDTDRDLFKDIVEELSLPVRKERISFDEQSETFKYLLITPVNGKTLVSIKECTFEDKKILQKFADDESISAAGASMVKYTNLTTSDVNELKDRDISKINAVIMGFLAQTAPSKR